MSTDAMRFSEANLQSYVVLHHYNACMKPQTLYSKCITKQMRLCHVRSTVALLLLFLTPKHPLLRWSEMNIKSKAAFTQAQ